MGHGGWFSVTFQIKLQLTNCKKQAGWPPAPAGPALAGPAPAGPGPGPARPRPGPSPRPLVTMRDILEDYRKLKAGGDPHPLLSTANLNDLHSSVIARGRQVRSLSLDWSEIQTEETHHHQKEGSSIKIIVCVHKVISFVYKIIKFIYI